MTQPRLLTVRATRPSITASTQHITRERVCCCCRQQTAGVTYHASFTSCRQSPTTPHTHRLCLRICHLTGGMSCPEPRPHPPHMPPRNPGSGRSHLPPRHQRRTPCPPRLPTGHTSSLPHPPPASAHHARSLASSCRRRRCRSCCCCSPHAAWRPASPQHHPACRCHPHTTAAGAHPRTTTRTTNRAPR